MDEKLTRKITQDDFITEKNDIIKNNLLGNYDENNEYHISSQIVDELISIEKLKRTSFGNSVFCVGNLLGYGEISFEVVYNNKTNNANAQAFLFVLENVDKINGYLQNTIRTQIAHFTSDLDDFIEESYKKFNIVGTMDDEGKTKKSLDDMNLEESYILAKKAYSLLLDKIGDERVLDAYGKYFTARLASLTKFDNAFTNAVLSNFNEEYALIQGVFLQQKNYKTLNELLDKCIEETSGIKPEFVSLEEDFNNAIKSDKDKFIANMQIIQEKSQDKAIDMLDKNDREKVEEILSSNSHSEKDLSSEGMVSEALAPKQSIDMLASEIEELTEKEQEDLAQYIFTGDPGILESADVSEADGLNTEEASEVDEVETESFEEETTEEIEDVSNVDDVVQEDSSIGEEMTDREKRVLEAFFNHTEEETVEEEETTEIDESIDEVSEEESSAEEIDEIKTLFSSEAEKVEESSLFADLKNYVEDTRDAEVEEEYEEEFDEIDSEIEKITAETQATAETQPEVVEESSMTIMDRLNRLSTNVPEVKKTYKKPQVKGDDNTVGRLYDLLDRSRDR